MRALILFPIGLILGVACTSDSMGGNEVPADIAGHWTNLTANLADQAAGLTCQSVGTIDIVQNGSAFTGNTASIVTCTLSGMGVLPSFPLAGNIDNGFISGNTITFPDDNGCDFTGTVSGTPANAGMGTADCTLTVNSTPHDMTGTWQANR
jgi:hypothetical protein